MRTQLRIICLLGLARLRSAGWPPWLLFVGWMLLAAVQEPRMLRRYGIHLLDDAAWTGGLALLIVLLLAERRLPRRGAVLSNLSALIGVAVLQATAAYACDRSAWAVPVSERGLDTARFCLAWAPAAIILARRSSASSAGKWSGVIVVLAAFAMGSMLAVALRSSSDSLSVLGAGLASLAAACWVVGNPESS